MKIIRNFRSTENVKWNSINWPPVLQATKQFLKTSISILILKSQKLILKQQMFVVFRSSNFKEIRINFFLMIVLHGFLSYFSATQIDAL